MRIGFFHIFIGVSIYALFGILVCVSVTTFIYGSLVLVSNTIVIVALRFEFPSWSIFDQFVFTYSILGRLASKLNLDIGFDL